MTYAELQALIYDAIGITARHDVVETIMLAARSYADAHAARMLEEMFSNGVIAAVDRSR